MCVKERNETNERKDETDEERRQESTERRRHNLQPARTFSRSLLSKSPFPSRPISMSQSELWAQTAASQSFLYHVISGSCPSARNLHRGVELSARVLSRASVANSILIRTLRACAYRHVYDALFPKLHIPKVY